MILATQNGSDREPTFAKDMPLKSDLALNASALDPKQIAEKTTAFNESLIELGRRGPKWYEVMSPSIPKQSFEAHGNSTVGRSGEIPPDAMEWRDTIPQA